MIINHSVYGEMLVDFGYERCGFVVGYTNTGLIDENHSYIYHQDNLINVTYDRFSNKWKVIKNQPDSNFEQEHLDELVKKILSIHVFYSGIMDWKKQILKRLEKSVPRLKDEYENACMAQANLQKVEFDPSKMGKV